MLKYEEDMKRELEFDPRKHRLKNGIRATANVSQNVFEKGKGFRLG